MKRSPNTSRHSRSPAPCAAASTATAPPSAAGWQLEGDPKIYAPTLVLWGDSDAVLPFAWSDKLPDFFPNLTFRKVEQAGHFLMREKPGLVNEVITEFILGGGSK